MSAAPDSLSVEFLLHCLSVAGPPSSVTHPPSSVRCKPLAVGRKPSAVWNAVLATAARHGLTPLLYVRLKQSGAQPHVPADAWERLRRAHVASAVRGMCFYRDLRLVLQRLRGSGIKVIVLKGAFLAQAVYGDDALRPMADVDLLVRDADLGRAQAVLLDMGGVHEQFGDIEQSRAMRLHLPQIHIRDLTLEIHWTIVIPAGPVRVDVAGLWDRSIAAGIAGVEAHALSPEDLLLHLCLHASYNESLGAGLRPLCDVAETIRRYRGELDWPQLADRARDWGATRYVGLTFHLVRTLLGAGVPDDVLDQLVPGGLDRRVLEAARQSVLTQTDYGRWQAFFDKMRAASLRDRARLSWKRIFLSREEMAAVYPSFRNSRFLCLYYVRRVGHVVRSYTTHTLRRARLMATSPERESSAALVRWLKQD